MIDVTAIARDVKAAQDRATPLVRLTERMSGFDKAAAYEVARLIHEARVGEGAVPVGRKIGFTNRDIWPVYGVYEPIWAYVYDTTVMQVDDAHGRCRLARFVGPRVEPEIVLHFRSAPPVTDDPAAILACVDWVAHGVEIVQSHFAGWKFEAADTIADSALHGALLVGARQPAERLGPDARARLTDFTITLACDGEVRARGHGANALGGPLTAAAHLVSVLDAQPAAARLGAGELVTTGTLTDAFPVRPGETWTTALAGIALPGLSVRFE